MVFLCLCRVKRNYRWTPPFFLLYFTTILVHFPTMLAFHAGLVFARSSEDCTQSTTVHCDISGSPWNCPQLADRSLSNSFETDWGTRMSVLRLAPQATIKNSKMYTSWAQQPTPINTVVLGLTCNIVLGVLNVDSTKTVNLLHYEEELKWWRSTNTSW